MWLLSKVWGAESCCLKPLKYFVPISHQNWNVSAQSDTNTDKGGESGKMQNKVLKLKKKKQREREWDWEWERKMLRGEEGRNDQNPMVDLIKINLVWS